MIILPAIDIKDSKAVRLTQGDYNKITVYSDNPLDFAYEFCSKGAEYLHIVDLNGAKDGKLSNYDIIKKIIIESGLKVEVGGGIRDEKGINQYLDAGAHRVILGTLALKDMDFLSRMINKYQEKIAVGVDTKNGFTATHGWLEVSNVSGYDFCLKLINIGVKTIIYTDISKDGTLQGTNLDIYKKLSALEGVNIIASGGISSYSEIEVLSSIGIHGAILGKAIYSGRLELDKAITAAKEKAN